MIKKLKYNFGATYRRKNLDKLQEKYKYLYNGVVLDIGGRDRGNFKKPRERVAKWTFADIEKKHNPDIVLDVTDMSQIKSCSIDVVNVIELFEHVKNIEKGLKECYRVLKKNGIMILSVPFSYQIHADPYDFQRWTKDKWRIELKKAGFKIEKFEIMGKFFTVLCDMLKCLVRTFPKILRHFCYLFYPVLNLLVKLDDMKLIKENKKLNKYHGGYFVVLKK